MHRRRDAAASPPIRRATPPPPTATLFVHAISSAHPPIRRCRCRRRRFGSRPARPSLTACDCVLDSDSVDLSGPMPQVLAEAIPGQGVRRAGGDIAAGCLVVEAGRRVLPRDLLMARAAGLERLNVRRPRLRIVNIPGGSVTADLIAESAQAAGAEIVCFTAAGRDAGSIAAALDDGACDLLLIARRLRRRPHRCGGNGIGCARRSSRPRHRPAARPHLGRRAPRQDARRRAAGRAGSGPCGMVDAGASRARSPVGPPPAQDGQSAAGAQDCIRRRHRRDRVAGAEAGHLDARWRWANCRSTRSPAPKPGSWYQAARKALRQAAPVDAYMLRD